MAKSKKGPDLKVLSGEFRIEGQKIKALEDGSVYFEGWANKAIHDRGGDLITKGEWNLKNYSKNAIILFNHDHSRPIGKAVNIEARDDGLYVKARISNSKDADIARVRDLVAEGILNSLSVGIYVGEEERTEKGNILKQVELHEISIVSVPMNQDSQFSLSVKSLEKPVIEVLRDMAGEGDVKTVLDHLEGEFKTVDDVAKCLSETASISLDAAHEFLKMSGDTPDEIKAFIRAKALEGAAIQAYIVSREKFPSLEDAVALGNEASWAVDQIEEREGDYLIVQRSADDFEGELRTIDLGLGVLAVIGELKAPSTEEPSDTPPEGEMEEEQKFLLNDVPNAAVPVPEGIPESNVEMPMLDQAKQTNVLLSQLIGIMQQVLDKMNQQPSTPPPQEVLVPKSNDVDDSTEYDKMVFNEVKSIGERVIRLMEQN